jgi:16S rRNA processing protein RimM
MKEVHGNATGTSEQLITIGRVAAAHGIKGWIKVYSYTDPPENITFYTPWYFKKSGTWVQIDVLSCRKQGKSIVAQLDKCETRNDAESHVGADIAIPSASLAPLKDGDYYWNQLHGLVVINTEQERFGTVRQFIQTGANDVMVVKADKESIDDLERLVPYVQNRVIKSIDLDAGEIIVDWDASW